MSELLALAFGALLILIDFGDSHLTYTIGNLDTIFGVTYWRVLEVLLPALSIFVLLLYGKTKGGFRFNLFALAAFISYLIVLGLVTLDDIAIVLNFSISLTKEMDYWVIMEWAYPLVSLLAFFSFGNANQPDLPNKEKEVGSQT